MKIMINNLIRYYQTIKFKKKKFNNKIKIFLIIIKIYKIIKLRRIN